MKILELILKVIIVAGGLSGFWSAYTTHDALKFKQPFEEHEQLAKSYLAQINSAEKRNDVKEVTRVRRDYEAFEEKWRAGRQIAKIVAPIEGLETAQLSAEETAALGKLIVKVAEGQGGPAVITSTTLGAAYLALNDFEDSAKQLDLATAKKKNPNAFALKAAAYSGLASNTTDPSLKQKYEAAAVASFNEAWKASPKSTELTDFALTIPSLKAILEEKGFKLTNR